MAIIGDGARRTQRQPPPLPLEKPAASAEEMTPHSPPGTLGHRMGNLTDRDWGIPTIVNNSTGILPRDAGGCRHYKGASRRFSTPVSHRMTAPDNWMTI